MAPSCSISLTASPSPSRPQPQNLRLAAGCARGDDAADVPSPVPLPLTIVLPNRPGRLAHSGPIPAKDPGPASLRPSSRERVPHAHVPPAPCSHPVPRRSHDASIPPKASARQGDAAEPLTACPAGAWPAAARRQPRDKRRKSSKPRTARAVMGRQPHQRTALCSPTRTRGQSSRAEYARPEQVDLAARTPVGGTTGHTRRIGDL